MSSGRSNISPEMRRRYCEAPDVAGDYSLEELRRLRVLLRRLRFLSTQLAQPDAGGATGREFVERERDALIFILTEIEYLIINN